MNWILDLIRTPKIWLPGQSISGAMVFHDHFPDRAKHGVRLQKVRDVAQILKGFDRAVKVENHKSMGLQFNVRKVIIIGAITLGILCLLSLPIGFDIVSYGAFQLNILGGPMLFMNCASAVFVGIFFWSSYKRKMDQVDRDKAYWKHQQVGNHVLVHALTEPFGLVPRYSRKDLIIMDDPVLLSDGTSRKKIDFAPGWIPRIFPNALPKRFKVKGDGKVGGLVSPGSKEWPKINVPVSYWKFEYERPFRLTMGEIYMEDGRWNNRPNLVKNDPAGLYTGTIIFGGTGTGKCFHGSTRIVDAESGALVTIRSLFEHRRAFFVWAEDREGQLVKRPVCDVINNGTRPVFRLNTDEGHSVVATANHPFRVVDGFRDLQELEIGEKIKCLVGIDGIPGQGSTCEFGWATIRSIEPVGIAETFDLEIDTDHNFVAEGLVVHNSQSALLNYVFQILAWNSQIESEGKAIDYLETVGKNLKVGDKDDFGYIPLDEILKLSEEAYDKMQEEGKGFAFEKMFMVLFEPKGELHVDIRAQLKILGRANDFVELGTDQIQIDRWRETRQRLHSSSMSLFGMWDNPTLESDLRNGLVTHMQPFWKSEIIRRFKSKEWASLGTGFGVGNADQFVPTPLTLKDFNPDAKPQIPAGSIVTLPNSKTASGDTALSDILKALEEATSKVATQLFSTNGFGVNEQDPNLFTGFVFKKEKVLREMGGGFQDPSLSDPVREALLDCLGLLASGTGVLETGLAKPGDATSSGVLDSSCDGLFRGLSAHKREGSLFPAFRGISLLPLPTVPDVDENTQPDIPILVASDLNGKSPLDDDEERLLKVVRTTSPSIRRSSGESYDEFVNRQRALKVLAIKRLKEFQNQFRRVCGSCSRLIDNGYEIQDVYSKLHEVCYRDSILELEECAGDYEFENMKTRLSGWQEYLRSRGYSPIAERANGQYDGGIRVGLQPIDAAWNFGCWESLLHLVEQVVSQVVSETVKRALGVSYSEASTKIGTGLKIHCHRFFESLNEYVGAVHQYYGIMTPATMGFVVRRVKDHKGLDKAANAKLESLHKNDPVGFQRLKGAWESFSERGHLGGDLVDGVGGEWFNTLSICTGTNQFNPLYQPDVAPESIASEMGASLTAGDKAGGESFWSDAYTTMAGQYIGLNMAASGWVTFNDVLNCFMHPSYRARLLMMAEARLEEMKALFRRFQDPAILTGAVVQGWGGQTLAEAQVAEREWELNQLRDMTGMQLGAGEWLGRYMDGGGSSGQGIKPVAGTISSTEFRQAFPSASVPESKDLVADLTLEGLLASLRDANVPVPRSDSPVLSKIAGAYLREYGIRIAGGKKRVLGKDKIQVSKTLSNSFLTGQLEFGLTNAWEFQTWKECLAHGIDAQKVSFSPPLTPTPILGSEIQALQSIIESYKNFDAVALKGDALKDAKTKGNIMISYMVKVFGLRSEAAIYSFSPRSRYSITFPTFDTVRTRGLVVCSRITEGVYQDVGMLISRMAIQQFQRVIKSRAGRQKTLLYGTNEAPPRIDIAHTKSFQNIQVVVDRLVPGDESDGRGENEEVPTDAKGRLDHYVQKVHQECDGIFSGLLSQLEKERLNVVTMRFLRSTLAQLGPDHVTQLPEALCDRVVLESLAFLGMLHGDRTGSLPPDLSDAIDKGDPSLPRSFQDDAVLRGMAIFANFPEVGYEVGRQYGRAFSKQVLEKLQRLFHQALGEYQGTLSFARMQGATARLRIEGQRGVEYVVARRDLLAEMAVIQDEPDFRRLGALVQDEVQKTVIPSTAKTDGDGGYLEVARAGMCFNIFATQFPNSLKKNLGEDFKRYLGNLLTWLCLMIPEPEDAKLVVEMFGVEDEGQSMSVEGSLEGVGSSQDGLRGRTENLNVKYDSKAEKKSVISVHDLMGLEAMQGYIRWRDGQRTRRGKLYTTPAFIVTGQVSSPVNPYGPKGLLLRAEEKLARKPNWVMSYQEAMNIVQDHGLPWVEEPVVVLIQHRMIDMSKSVSGEEAERDARLHANRAYLQVRR